MLAEIYYFVDAFCKELMPQWEETHNTKCLKETQ